MTKPIKFAVVFIQTNQSYLKIFIPIGRNDKKIIINSHCSLKIYKLSANTQLNGTSACVFIGFCQ